MKKFLSVLLFFLLVGCSTLCFPADFAVVHASTDVSGIISSDATWSKEGSPYSLSGPILVNSGVTLTIEPGVTVYLNDNYIRVNGTLFARGSKTDMIHLEISSTPVNYLGKDIEFTSFSADWDDQLGTGCIIENTVVNTGLSVENSPKINNNIINSRIRVSGRSTVVISNNTITDRILVSYISSVVISNNSIVAQKGYSSTIAVTGGAAVIANNTITCSGDGGGVGIHIEGENHIYILDNVISGFGTCGVRAAGPVQIERNFLVGNDCGIQIGDFIGLTGLVFGSGSNIIIRNNTIQDNVEGIHGPTSSSTIIYNRIQNNDYNIVLRDASTVNATYNLWGTTDSQAINQTFFDFTNDFNLGTVIFTPFLTEPYPKIEPVSTPEPPAEEPEPPTQDPEPSEQDPDIPEFSSWIVLPILFSFALLVKVYKKRLYKTPIQQSY